jgi:imidazolonepropionase-like amidohydrolase
MRSWLRILALGIALAGVHAWAAPPSKTLYVKCGKLIYDTERPPLENAALVVENGKIVQMGQNLPVPASAEQIDLSRYTVLPGLLDAHIHLWTGPWLSHPSTPLAALRASRAMAYALSLGVVAVRVLGSNDFIDVALGQAIAEGTIPGPHVIPAGHALTIPGGHGDFFDLPAELPLQTLYTPLHGFVNSPADAEQAVHLQIKYGARVIKVLASGGVLSPLDSPTAEQLSPEELRVICQQAHMANLKVAAHAENLRSIRAALEAGVDSIEHGPGLDEEAARFMIAHHVYLDPTLFIVENLLKNGERLHLPAYALRKARELSVLHFASFARALRAGVPMAAGSDQMYGPGSGTVLDEVIALVDHGMTPAQALTAATKHNAELLGLPELGTLAVGQEASLVAVEGDPLQDIHAVKNTRFVLFRGQPVSFAGQFHWP